MILIIKRVSLLLSLFTLAILPIQGQGWLQSYQPSGQIPYRMGFGVIVGTDIGGSIPVPFSALGGEMQALPKLHITLGGRLSTALTPNWTGIIEVNYKQVEMEANARVTNQKATLPDIGAQYFSGTAKILMNYSILEVPLLFRWQYKQTRSHILFGSYGAWIPNASFLNSPIKGFLGNRPDYVGSNIDQPSKESNMDFSDRLDKWDAGIILGFESRILTRLTLGIRLSLGFKDVFRTNYSPLEYGMYHMRGSIALSYDILTWKK